MGATNRAPRTPEIGALLRREGLYSSQLTDWRREREAGQLQRLSSSKRGRPRDEQSTELVSLRQENAQLKAQLAQAELIMAAPKKLAQALEQTLMPSKGIRL
jgi:transposase-like protein